MTDSLRSVLPRPVAIFLIAGCLVAYVASPKGADEQLASAGGPIRAAGSLPPAADMAPVSGAAGSLLQTGIFAVIDQGPWPIAGAMAVPMLALALRRRCES